MATDSDDSAVLAKAQGLEALISLNGDFADIVMYPPANFLGIIALQVKDHPEVIPALLRRLLNYVPLIRVWNIVLHLRMCGGLFVRAVPTATDTSEQRLQPGCFDQYRRRRSALLLRH